MNRFELIDSPVPPQYTLNSEENPNLELLYLNDETINFREIWSKVNDVQSEISETELHNLNGQIGLVGLGIINSAPQAEFDARATEILRILETAKSKQIAFLELSGGYTLDNEKSEARRIAEAIWKSLEFSAQFNIKDLSKILYEKYGTKLFLNQDAKSTQENFSNTDKHISSNNVENLIIVTGNAKPSAARARYWALKKCAPRVNVLTSVSSNSLIPTQTDKAYEFATFMATIVGGADILKKIAKTSR